MRCFVVTAVALAFTGCGGTTQPQLPTQTAEKLAFGVQPVGAEAGVAINPPVAVAILDSLGVAVQGATDSVTLAIGNNPASGTLFGTTTVAAVNGVATFNTLGIDRPGTRYTLVATSGTLAGAITVPFDVRLTFATVSVGEMHSCGVTTAGKAYCWGANGNGQLGDGTATNRTSPVAVVGGLTFSTVSAGRNHTCGTTTGSATYCWGSNDAGQLGDGTTTTRTSPVLVVSGVTFATVSAGEAHTCGVTFGGIAYCWGGNTFGQIGDGTTTGRTGPTAVVGGLTFATVSAGRVHTCGVTTAGAAYCWGSNANGELGDGTTIDETSPVAVVGSLTFTRVSAAGAHTCGVTQPGGVAFCWGGNGYGELGDGTTTERTMPSAVYSTILKFASVSAGYGYSCGVRPGGTAYCWGHGLNGELGDGTTADWTRPVAVVGGLSFASVSAGFYHSCGVTTGGDAYCWGYAILGDGTTSTSLVPVHVVP